MSAHLCLARGVGLFAILCAVGAAGTARAEDFTYAPPGELVPGSGTGRVDNNVYVPGMRYPIEAAPSFANSQVWGNGGSQGPGGSQCDAANFSYPWHDNYCETRSWDMPLCPSGVGHQGQDIRAATCDKNVHWVVAAEAGAVTNVGTYSVYITAADGTRFDYLHMGQVQVTVGDDVTKGQRIGMVSNEFGGTPTSVHMHFNLRQNVAGVGTVYVPPYLSLVTSYQALVGPVLPPAQGALDAVDCEGIRGWAASQGDLDVPIEARLFFDGSAGDGQSVGHPILADQARDDLCDALGSCDHGFDVGLPLSLFDAKSHDVRAYASDGSSSLPELAESPKSFTCPFVMPTGVRRKIAGPEAKNAWRFSTFWDEIGVSDGLLDSLPVGSDLDDAPRLVVSASEPDTLWLVDGSSRRLVGSVAIARAWEFDSVFAETLADADLAALPVGADVRVRPIILRSASGDSWLVDDGPGSSGAGGGGSGDDAGLDADGEGCSCSTQSSSRSSGPGRFASLSFLVLALLASWRGNSRYLGG